MAFRGRIALREGDIQLLRHFAGECKTYVEIGTLFGGSALQAGLAGCEVTCIDPLDGYYASANDYPMRPDWPTGLIPSVHTVKTNWLMAGLDPSKLHIYPQLHPPWPDEIKDARFDMGFIDGDHTRDGCWADFLAMNERVTKYILIHNMEKPAIQSVYNVATGEYGWTPRLVHEYKDTLMGVLKK